LTVFGPGAGLIDFSSPQLPSNKKIVPGSHGNPDESVDIYFGPEPPKGLESNWIPTEGKRPMPCMRIYGGEEAYWNKSFKLPDVELAK
jgi:hypothetical protein